MHGYYKFIYQAVALLVCTALHAGFPGQVRAKTESEERPVVFRREVVNLEDLAAPLSRDPLPSVRRAPPIEGDVWYGEIYRQLPGDAVTSREHNVPFAVLFQGSAVVRAWSDRNMNGNLWDDPKPALSVFPGDRPARSFLTELRWTVRHDGREVPIQRLVRVVVQSRDSTISTPQYRTQDVYGMLSTVDVDGVPRLALLFDANRDGLYTKGRSDGIFFDLDGDRHFTIDTMAPEFGPLAIPFSVGHTRYTVDAVDPRGTEIALRALGPAPPAWTPTPGLPVPDFEYEDVDRRPVRLSAYRGTPVAVYFWASWCSSCRRNASELRALYERFSRSGLEVLGVSYDTDSREMRRFREEHRCAWPTSFTGGLPPQDPVGRLFREAGAGVFYIVGPDGRLAGKAFEVSDLEDQLSKLKVLGGGRAQK
jgi:thiol-disulfide isomerase/thioredoxin